MDDLILLLTLGSLILPHGIIGAQFYVSVIVFKTQVFSLILKPLKMPLKKIYFLAKSDFYFSYHNNLCTPDVPLLIYLNKFYFPKMFYFFVIKFLLIFLKKGYIVQKFHKSPLEVVLIGPII